MTPGLYWLPPYPEWSRQIADLERRERVAWSELAALANAPLDLVRTERLNKLLRRFAEPPRDLTSRPIRLALLGSSTLAHLHAGIRVAGLRRGLWVSTYEAEYGQYLQELLDPESGLHRFRPDTVLLSLDARHLAGGLDRGVDAAGAEAALQAALANLRQCWSIARQSLGATVLQQTVLPVFNPLLGQNEQRLPDSPDRFVARFNAALRDAADREGVHLVALDSRAAQDGVRAWHDPVLWHRAKQEISPAVAPLYGELVARLLAARQGRSAKCLVLDLDNTLWGGVIGDDGWEGLVLGQGSALGEAFLAVQHYAQQLSRRGVILAVCSKNDEANAIAGFERHPEMLLRRDDIACFVANWDDKATNLRRIAKTLNIGLDALVFVDDNPFERNLVRQELPEVAVPEIPHDDPAFVPQVLADAGYFEALALTGEDRERTAQYQANQARAQLQTETTDLASYLRGLEMEIVWRRFDRAGLPRIVQLINKTNQFNLTTRRYTEEDVLAVMADERAFGLQLRLLDRFGDNGIIAIVIGRANGHAECLIDTWLMSCRVLGRQVEEATLNLAAAEARRLGAKRLVGEYTPTPKNAMVAGHYARLGFTPVERQPDGAMRGRLEIAGFAGRETFIRVTEGGAT